VLCIGNSFSGEDIAVFAMKYGANSAVVSYQTAAKGYKWPYNIDEVPPV